MTSVTQRIQQIKQPRGGYIRPRDLNVIQLEDDEPLFEYEYISPSIIGMAVDYITRLLLLKKTRPELPLNEAQELVFQIAIAGYDIRKKLFPALYKKSDIPRGYDIDTLLTKMDKIYELDLDAIYKVCEVTTYDVWYRNGLYAISTFSDPSSLQKDYPTLDNIRIMVKRSLSFFDAYGPITKEHFTFEEDGYTDVVSSGDGDFLTSDTLWDFKVSKANPRTRDTLQILIYWIMGIHSKKPEFKNITKIGIFNPRLNRVYTYETKNIPKETIQEVENNIICYK